MRGPYDVVMVDPPWPVGTVRYTAPHRAGTGGRVGVPYRTAALDALWLTVETEILPHLTERATVFLWTLDRFLLPAEQFLESRGFVRHVRLIWDKGDTGMTPCGTVRFTHEYLLWFYRPPLQEVAKNAQGAFTTLIRERRRQNSRKPSAAYALVEALYPDARRLDAFTREYRPGWDGWGDQRDYFTPLLAPLREAEP